MLKNAVKEVRSAVADNSPDQAQERFIKAVSIIHKTASKGIIHKNKASRKISRLARKVNQLQTAK